MVLLTLGGVALERFEVPARIRLGGAQALAVHKLPGGVRVVDAMGRDDSDLTWSGMLTGTDASVRAKQLDAMRADGTARPLSWDGFVYTVVIARLEFDYCNPWWIPYRIDCTVVRDEAQANVATAADEAASIFSDLTAASAFFDLSGALALSGVPGALTKGTAAYAEASGSVEAAEMSMSNGIEAAGGMLSGDDLASAVLAAGGLAQLCCGRAYVARAAANLAESSQ